MEKESVWGLNPTAMHLAVVLSPELLKTLSERFPKGIPEQDFEKLFNKFSSKFCEINRNCPKSEYHGYFMEDNGFVIRFAQSYERAKKFGRYGFKKFEKTVILVSKEAMSVVSDIYRSEVSMLTEAGFNTGNCFYNLGFYIDLDKLSDEAKASYVTAMKFALENWFPENYAILDTICLQSGFFKIIKLGLVIFAVLLLA